MKADHIFERFKDFKIFGINKFNFLLRESLLKDNFLKQFVENDLPKTFEELKIPLFIGATDLKKANFIIFNK